MQRACCCPATLQETLHEPVFASMALTDAALQAAKMPLTGLRLPAPPDSDRPAESLHELMNARKMVILHFLRHLGCIFCKHSVANLRELNEANPGFPPIVFVHQSPLEQGESFFDEYYPSAAHISDPELKLYELFEINRLSGLQWLNPGMFMKGTLAFLKGHRQTKAQGQEDILSGTFLFNKGHLVWQHRATYAGDEPDWSRFGGKKA